MSDGRSISFGIMTLDGLVASAFAFASASASAFASFEDARVDFRTASSSRGGGPSPIIFPSLSHQASSIPPSIPPYLSVVGSIIDAEVAHARGPA